MHYPLYPVSHHLTFRSLIADSCTGFRNLVLFETTNGQTTYGEFAAQIAAGCRRLSGFQNQYILISVARTDLFAIALFATVLSGNIACIANPTAGDAAFPFRSLQLAACIEEKTVLEWVRGAVSVGSNFDWLPQQSGDEPDRRAVILCSSGTTAEPKGVCLSQRNLCSCAEAGIQLLEYPKGCRYVSVLPMYHAFGIVGDLLGAIYTGGTLCLPDSFYQLFVSLRRFRPDAMHLPPAAADRLAALLRSEPVPDQLTGGRLRKIMCAGAPLNRRTITELRGYGIQTFAAYGLTECSPCVSMNRDLDYKDGSCGLILANNRVKIAPDGEILVHGDGVMRGYLDDPALTAQTIVDGWLHTGDLGHLDADGFLYVTGRKKNLIVFPDGTKLVPEALEDKLNRWAEIAECLVEGCADGLQLQVCLNGPIPAAVSAEEMTQRIRQFVMAETRHKVLHLELSDQPLRRNAAGKIIRGGKEP